MLVVVITGIFGMNAIVQNSPYNATFSLDIPPGQYHYLPLNVVGEGRISGDFAEVQSQLVNFYVVTEHQYETYKSTGILDYLFFVINAASATYDTHISSPGSYYLIITHSSGYESNSEQISLHLRLDGTNSWYLGLEGLVLVAVVGLPVFFTFRKRENKKQAISFLKDNPNYGLGNDEDDRQILTIAKELCRDLQVKFDPVTVYYIVWISFGGVRLAPSDRPFPGVKGPRQGWIHLPAVLRGKLSPSEWRPLIASSLIYMFNPSVRPKRRLGTIIMTLVALAIAVVGVLVTRQFYLAFPTADSALERFLLFQFPILFTPAFFLVVLVARKWNIALKTKFLQADDIAAMTFGRESLLQTLTKIDSMALPDLEQGKLDKPTIWRRQGALPWPSITQRIQRLQDMH